MQPCWQAYKGNIEPCLTVTNEMLRRSRKHLINTDPTNTDDHSVNFNLNLSFYNIQSEFCNTDQINRVSLYSRIERPGFQHRLKPEPLYHETPCILYTV